jgi:YHS domain-containing protein
MNKQMSQNNELNLERQSILENEQSFEIVSSFWNLFDKNLKSTVDTENVITLFATINTFLKITDKREITADYIHEQIYTLNALDNQSIIEKTNCKQSQVTFVKGFKSTGDSRPTSEECEKQRLQETLNQVTFIQFFHVMINFTFMVVINNPRDNFCLFWEYLHIRVISFKLDEVHDFDLIKECEVNLYECMQTGSKNKNYVWIHEQVKIDRSLIYERQSKLGLHKKIMQVKNRHRIGEETRNKLMGYANDKFGSMKGNWVKFKESIGQNIPVYTFYVIVEDNRAIYMNQCIFDKYLFEEVKPENQKEKVWRNVLNQAEFIGIDHIDRFNAFCATGKNPYYLNSLEKEEFEVEPKSVTEYLTLGYKFAHETMADSLGRRQTRRGDGKQGFLKCDKPGIETEIKRMFYDIDPIEDKRTANILHNQLLELSIKKQLRIVILGKRFSGKSKVASVLSKLLNIENVNVDELISEEIKAIEVIAEELKTRQQGELSEEDKAALEQDLEKYSLELEELEHIKSGGNISSQFINHVIRKKQEKLKQSFRGYIIELSSVCFGQDILKTILAEDSEKLCIDYFIKLKMDRNEFELRAKNQRQLLVSKEEGFKEVFLNKTELKEIELQIKRAESFKAEEYPEKKKEILDALEPEFKESIENVEQFAFVNSGFKHMHSEVEINAMNEANEVFEEVDKNTMIDFIIRKSPRYISVDIEGMTMRSIIKTILVKLDFEKCEIPVEISDGGALEGLLESGKSLDAFDIRRNWSFYKTIDCVEFLDLQNIKTGLAEFAVNFENFVFVFASEQNRNTFIASPSRYLRNIPKLDAQFNLLVLSPDNKSVKECLIEISKIYNLKFVDFCDYIQEKLTEIENPKEESFKQLKNLFENVSISFNDIFKGIYINEPVNGIEVLKLFLLEQKVHMEIKFDEEEETKMLNEKVDPKSKKKIVPKPQRNLTLASVVSNSTNVKLMNEFYEKIKETEQPEEVVKKYPTEPFVRKPIQPVKGYLFYNIPFNQEIEELLSSVGVDFYKIVSLMNKEDEGSELLENNPAEYSVAKVLEEFAETRDFIKTTYGEDRLMNLDYNENQVQTIKNQIVDFIDPFKDKIDSEIIKVNYAFDSSGPDSELLRFGSFGKICPVSFIDRGWYLVCQPQNQSLQINGHLYCFSDEPAKENFRLNYQDYIDKLANIEIKPYIQENFRIFVMGAIGAGTCKITEIISERCSVEVLNIKKHILEKKAEFIRERVIGTLLRNGFNAEQQEEQNTLLQLSKYDVLKLLEKYEPETPEEEQTFEENLIKTELIQAKNKVIIIDLFMTDEEKQIFKSDIKEVLIKLNLIPSVLIILQAGSFISHNRIFKKETLRQTLEFKLREIKSNNRELIEMKREQLFLERSEEDKTLTIDMIEVNEAELQLEPEINIDEEIEKENVAIKDKRDKQVELINDFVESLKDYQIALVKVNTEMPLAKVVSKIDTFLKKSGDTMVNHFQNCQFSEIKDAPENEELSAEKKLEKMIQSKTYKLSDLGLRNVLNPKRFVTNYDNNIVYQNKIYFVETQEEKNKIMDNPGLIKVKQAKKIKHLNPIVYFVQPIFNKKLKKQLKKEFNFKIVSFKKVLAFFFEKNTDFDLSEFDFKDFPNQFKPIKSVELQHRNLTEVLKSDDGGFRLKEIRKQMREAVSLTDEQKVYLIVTYIRVIRLEGTGILLNGFPENVTQFGILCKMKIFPNLMFTFNYEESDYRSKFVKDGDFYQNPEMISQLVYHKNAAKRVLEQFILYNYGCLYTLNKAKSNESNFEIIKNLIDKQIDSYIKAIDRYNRDEGFQMSLLPVSRNFVYESFTNLGRIELTNWMQDRRTQLQTFKYEELYYYQNAVYCDSKPETLEEAISQNKRLKMKTPHVPEIPNDHHYICNNFQTLKEKAPFDRVCPICHSKKQANKGYLFLCIVFEESLYFFCSLIHFHKFFVHPLVYKNQKVNQTLIAKVNERPVVLSKEKQVINELTIVMNHICKLKLKYPTLTIKATALNLLSIFLKYRNPFKDERYQKKYELKLNRFINECQEIEKISKEVNLQKKEYKNIEMKFLKNRIEGFLGKIQEIEKQGKENYLLNFLK